MRAYQSAPPFPKENDSLVSSRELSNKEANETETIAKQYTFKIKDASSWKEAQLVLDEMEREGVERTIHLTLWLLLAQGFKRQRRQSDIFRK